MATLVLTAVGSAIAGPIGAAIGAMAGQRVDQMLFAPKARSGARLANLAVQTSSYGTSLPKVFGRMRVSGAVIWATDLREERKTVSQGKGRPKATVYSYSASFAVALSARAAVRVGRIWADGKLLRGEAGDFKVETGFRFHGGHEDQMPDPLIASAEGIGQTPAYRGLAYAVFEDMALESFGNRIPMLSFELIADEGEVGAGEIIAELAGEVVGVDCPSRVLGYVADGASVRAAIAPLVDLVSARAWHGGAALRVAESAGSITPLPRQSLGATIGARQSTAQLRRARTARGGAVSSVELGYADVARDLQPGLQRADRFAGHRALLLDVPAAMEAERAYGLARQLLGRHMAEAETLEISVPWRHLDLLEGGAVQIEGVPQVWRIHSLSWAAMHITLTLAPLIDRAPLPAVADAGRGTLSPDLIHGPTRLVLLDLPPLEAGVAQAPSVVAAAAGASPGWKRAALLQSIDGGKTWTDAGETAAPATIGVAITPPGVASAAAFDAHNGLIVDLLHADMALNAASDAALLAGANLAMLGKELLQFGAAERLGPVRYRLSHLLRGRRGTEHAIAGHAPGEDFVLLARDSVAPLAVPAGAAMVSVMAMGLGDAAGVQKDSVVSGLALRPLSPVHLVARAQLDGGLLLSWVRRSRDGWGWHDAVDAPLAEEREDYRVTLSPDAGAAQVQEVSQPGLAVSAAQLAAWRAAGANHLHVDVQQAGTFGASLPAGIVIEL